MNYRKTTTNGLELSPGEMGMIRAILGNNIRRLRRRRKYTIEGLSAMAGIHGTFLGHIELGGKAPSIHTLVKIARALEVPPAALLRGIR